MALIDELQELLGTLTLAEGAEVINNNFEKLKNIINELSPEEIGDLIQNGDINSKYLSEIGNYLSVFNQDNELIFDSENFDATTVNAALEELISLLSTKLNKPDVFSENEIPKFNSDGEIIPSEIFSDKLVVSSFVDVEGEDELGTVATFLSSQNITNGPKIGEPDGLATLDSTGRIPREQYIGPASQTNIWVDATIGDDVNNDGRDMTKPLATIDKAVELATPGTTIKVSSGDYFVNNPLVLDDRVGVVGDNLRNVRIYPNNPKLDIFHVKALNYLYGLRLLNHKSPSFAVAFPCSTAEATLFNKTIASIDILYQPGGYDPNFPPSIVIDEPEESGGRIARATSVIDQNGDLVNIVINDGGDGYLKPPHISIAAPADQQPFITGSTYVQNCSSITGPFDLNGDQISMTAPLPYDFENGFTYTDPFTQEIITHLPVNETGAGGGMRVDGRVCFGYNEITNLIGYSSPLRSMVADSFTQVNQGGPGHLITNRGYTQFVSCFTTFCTYSYKAQNGGFANISNSVTDFGEEGLVSVGKDFDFYTSGRSLEQISSEVVAIEVINGGAGYTENPVVNITGGEGSGATAEAQIDLDSGSVTKILVTNPGQGYTETPDVTIGTSPTGQNAEASAVLSVNSSIKLYGIYEDTFGRVRRPDAGSLMFVNDQYVTINNVEEIDSGFEVSFYPGINAVNQGELLFLFQPSVLSSGGHVFEYPGTGVTYNALPEYGGIPDESRDVVVIPPGKVFVSSTSNVGTFKVGPQFSVEQSTGVVTINTDQFNLSGINQIGPFETNGVPFGEAIREMTNNETLESDSGFEANTVASVAAIKTYIESLQITDLNDVNNVAAESPEEGQFLRWDSINLIWKVDDVPLGDVSDVDLQTVIPSPGTALIYQTPDWRPGYPDYALGLTNGGVKTIQADAVFDHVTDISGNPHQLDANDVNAIDIAEKGAASGVAPLNSSSQVPSSFLPGFVSGAVYAVTDDTERDALSASEGDVARVSDSAEAGNTAATYVYDADTLTWLPFNLPESVISVNGQTGGVALTTSDVPEGSNEYYTESKVDTRIQTLVNSQYVNNFFLSAQEVRDTVDPTLLVEAAQLYNHVNSIFDESVIPTSGPNAGTNPHGLTPEAIGAFRDDNTTDDLAEGSINKYYTEARVINLVNTEYVNSLLVDAATLNNIGATQFLRSDIEDVFFGTLIGPDIVLGESRIDESHTNELQVNGTTRTGNIYLHADGVNEDQPSATARKLAHVLGGNGEIENQLYWVELDEVSGETPYLIWTEENMGPDSGLDADTVDGLEAEAFSLVGHTHDTSDIISGTFDDARIASSNVTQHEADLTITKSQVSDFAHTHPISEIVDLQTTLDGKVETNTSITAGTATKITYDEKGLVTAGETLISDDIPDLDAEKITSGTFNDNRIAQSSITQYQSFLSIALNQISDLSDGSFTGVVDFSNATVILPVE